VQSASGSSVQRQILDIKDISMQLIDWAPDGKELLVDVQQTLSGMDVWSVPVTGGEPRKLLTSSGSEYAQCFSPDGRWILYVSNESGRDELYAALHASPGTRFQVSDSGARSGQWMPDGHSILYVASDGLLRRAAVNGTGQRLVLGASETVFGGRALPGDFDIAPDGTRLLVAVPEGGANTTLRLVTDWRALAAARSSGSR
jgi:TolB protein